MTALAGLLAVSLTNGALAQSGPPLAGGPQGDGHRAMQERMCRDFDARVAGRIAFTEAKLQVTPAQRAAWDEFAAAMRAAAEPMKRLRCEPRASLADDDVAGRLAARERRLTAMLDSTRLMRVAAERLQPQLSAEQRTQLAEAMRMDRGDQERRFHLGHHGQGSGWRR
jgi:hypothetical protein